MGPVKLPLRYYGDPILRKMSAPIESITDEIRQLAQDMIDTMIELKGIGLAAPQVGKLVRLFVSNIAGEDEQGELLLGEAKVFINPVLFQPSEGMVERSEGCLSLPHLYLPITRPLSIRIEATDLKGDRFQEDCYGYVARCMMHENDHLNGTLFIDRVKGKRRSLIEPVLRKIKLIYG